MARVCCSGQTFCGLRCTVLRNKDCIDVQALPLPARSGRLLRDTRCRHDLPGNASGTASIGGPIPRAGCVPRKSKFGSAAPVSVLARSAPEPTSLARRTSGVPQSRLSRARNTNWIRKAVYTAQLSAAACACLDDAGGLQILPTLTAPAHTTRCGRFFQGKPGGDARRDTFDQMSHYRRHRWLGYRLRRPVPIFPLR